VASFCQPDRLDRPLFRGRPLRLVSSLLTMTDCAGRVKGEFARRCPSQRLASRHDNFSPNNWRARVRVTG